VPAVVSKLPQFLVQVFKDSPNQNASTYPIENGLFIYVVSPLKFVAVSQSHPNPAVLIFERSSAPPAIALSSLTLNPTSIIGGAQVALSSSSSVASVPSSVNGSLGSCQRNFHDEHVHSSLASFRQHLRFVQKYDADCLVRMTETLADPIIQTTGEDFRVYRRHSRQVVPCVTPE